MVWLSVIVMGFLLLGRLAQTLLARYFEGSGPPCQLIEHLPGGLIEMLEFAQRLAVFDHGQVIGKQDVNGAADRRHLQLDGVQPQLLYRASAANAASFNDVLIDIVLKLAIRVARMGRISGVVCPFQATLSCTAPHGSLLSR